MSGSFYICVQHPISVGTEGSQVSDSHISGKWGNILTKGCVYFLYSPISGSFDLLICSHQVRDQSFFIIWARVEGIYGGVGLYGFRENRGGSFFANRVPWGSYRKLNANLQPMRGGIIRKYY